MKNKSYEPLDISGDVGIRVRGRNIKELFKNTAIGMYSLITNIDTVDKKKTIHISVESHSLDGLIISWLNELIFHFDTYGFIGKGIDITKLKDNRINAVLSGDGFDPERHEKRLLIKAATYHRLKLEKTEDGWRTEVIFDI